MRFSPEFLASLREQVPLSQIVGRAVSWDKRKSQPGRGDLWACCPFHQEKTPSFHVDDRKGYYHCFGCHESGDHISFLTNHDGMDFVDAVKELANLAGVPLPEPDRPEPAAFRERRSERSALEAAAALYESTLWGTGGRAARDYATGRGFSEETLKTFGFGLAPNTQGFLVRHLAREGVAERELERAGLAVRRDGGPLRDRFRGRLMVPIHDPRGRIVGFGGRTLDGRDPKYLNSPETPLFDKSTLLFNAHRARGPAHRSGRLFVVEGYLDAVAVAAAGVDEVVASLGTALTEAQIKLAWTLADEPILCFDGDNAGRSAAHRAIDRIIPLLSGGHSFHFLALPEGQDPDDLIQSGGRAAFDALAERAVPLVDAVFEREADKGADTPERLAALESRLDAIAGQIGDERVSRLYHRAFRDRLFALRRAQSRPAKREERGRATLAAPPLPAPATLDRALLDLERITLGLLILRPSFIERFGERLGEGIFVSDAHAGFLSLVMETYAQALPETPEDLTEALPPHARMCLSEVWGEGRHAVGPRLLERFSILTCEPGDDFLARCMTLFLNRLSLRAEVAELANEPSRLAGSGADGESRLLSLSAAVHAHTTAVQDAERALADEAAAIRRTRALAGTVSPSKSLL
ncbi:DNA primase [Acuticoccus mangrovi]|uniref:DNA primase n=1 Tax=Acuticoccus mangrovi TaxID=2796142 RepID=A0A934ILT6_9HYPH|nr:DNA primase [Acuticoccus mangrovi]MBJ3774995.1 DNA primase [Acuticoccus mangrovi]